MCVLSLYLSLSYFGSGLQLVIYHALENMSALDELDAARNECKRPEECKSTGVVNWLNNTALPCIRRILLIVGGEVTLLPFGSVPSGYSVESSDVDLIVCIEGK